MAALASRSADFRSLDCNAASARSSALRAAGLRPFESAVGCATPFCRRLEAVWALVADTAMSKQATQGKLASKSRATFCARLHTFFDSLVIDNFSLLFWGGARAKLGIEPFDNCEFTICLIGATESFQSEPQLVVRV